MPWIALWRSLALLVLCLRLLLPGRCSLLTLLDLPTRLSLPPGSSACFRLGLLWWLPVLCLTLSLRGNLLLLLVLLLPVLLLPGLLLWWRGLLTLWLWRLPLRVGRLLCRVLPSLHTLALSALLRGMSLLSLRRLLIGLLVSRLSLSLLSLRLALLVAVLRLALSLLALLTLVVWRWLLSLDVLAIVGPVLSVRPLLVILSHNLVRFRAVDSALSGRQRTPTKTTLGTPA